MALGSDGHYYKGAKSVTTDLENGKYYQAEVAMADAGKVMTLTNNKTEEVVVLDSYTRISSNEAPYTLENTGYDLEFSWFGGAESLTLKNISLNSRNSSIWVYSDEQDIENTKSHHLVLDGVNTMNCADVNYAPNAIVVRDNSSLHISAKSADGKLNMTNCGLGLNGNSVTTIESGEISVSDLSMWENSTLRYHLGFEYDQTIIVEETSPTGENWYHHYSFTGMTYVYSHTSSEPYDYAEGTDEMDETDVRLPEEAELKDEDNDRELYVNVDGVGSENGQWSVWMRDKITDIVTYLFATENTAAPRWSEMQDGNGIKVSIDEIAAGNCYTALFIPWDSDKIFVEGCPDDRNVWSYIIDINTKEAIQLPTNEGLIAIDPGKQEIHMSHYLYDLEGGRYSVERVYTIDGRFTGKEYRIAD